MSAKSVGPSLLDLQIRTSSTIEQVSWFISGKAVGAMIGALVLGKCKLFLGNYYIFIVSKEGKPIVARVV